MKKRNKEPDWTNKAALNVDSTTLEGRMHYPWKRIEDGSPADFGSNKAMPEEKYIPIDRYKSNLNQSTLIEYTVTIDRKGGVANERNV